MTCIGAIRTVEKNGDVTITFGADTCVSSYRVYGEYESTKITKKSDMLIASAGALRYADLLNYNFVPPVRGVGEEAKSYIATKFIAAVISVLKTHQHITNKNENIVSSGTMLVAYDSKVFKISSDFSLMEFNEHTAIGSGADYMLGALYATKDMKDAEKRLELGLEAASMFDFFVAKPYHFEKMTFKGKETDKEDSKKK